MAQVTGKVALITGANRGLGFETARQLAQQGVKVLLGARTAAKSEEAAAKLRGEGLDVEPITLDVTDSNSIQSAAAHIESRYGKLDILVNNAGIMVEDFGATPSRTSQEALRKTFDTNFFRVIELTQTLLPLIRKSEAGRIVNLSSILGSLTSQSDPASPYRDVKLLAYNSSKAALNAFTVHLAYELQDTPIKVNSAHPGWVKTDMGGENAPLEIEDGVKTSVWLATLPAEGPNGGFYHLGEALPW
jgi:NAD(P)-dependent dehydrogenase (short-subunit alcohol dehydrogenase family)